ncbi:MAG TPA: aminotransferase class IV [Actinomycetales bacterium]|nr:aminotransferase class IV [Actinomycetales bacterium]
MFETTGPVVWVDGKVTGPDAARVPALDHGLIVGDGVFETCKVADGVPFALTRHLRRLDRSARGLGLPVPDDAAVRDAVGAVLGAKHLALGRLRITWTGGSGPLGSGRTPGGGTLVVAAEETSPWPARAGAVRVPWTRNERSATAGIKTTSYADNVVALAYATERGGAEALFANTRGELCEGTGSNVLVADGDLLVTPPLSSGCLAGITRELLLEWAAADGLPVVERDLPFDVLATAEQVLLTSSTRDVQVLAHMDGRPLVDGGLATAAVELFARRSAADPDPM